MYTRASPGLLHITPSLERIGGYTERPAGVVSTESVSTASEATATDASKKHAGGSTEISSGALLGSSTTLPPLRVGFVSKFFGDQVRKTST